jgi:hypothetical protein
MGLPSGKPLVCELLKALKASLLAFESFESYQKRIFHHFLRN